MEWALIYDTANHHHVLAVSRSADEGYVVAGRHEISTSCFCKPQMQKDDEGAVFFVHACPTCEAHECVCDDLPNRGNMSLFIDQEQTGNVMGQWRDKKTHAPLEAPSLMHKETPTHQSFDRELSTHIPDESLRAAVDDYAHRPRHEKSDPLTVDELARMREENDYEAAQYRFYEQEELISEKDRMGRPMQDTDFLKLMNEIVPSQFVLGQMPTKKGIFYAVGLRCRVPSKDGGDWVAVSQIHPGIAPEFSIIRVDEHRVPLNHKYIGWRGTVLLRAITKGVVTEEEVESVFGEAPTGIVSRRYRAMLHGIRNRRNIQ